MEIADGAVGVLSLMVEIKAAAVGEIELFSRLGFREGGRGTLHFDGALEEAIALFRQRPASPPGR